MALPGSQAVTTSRRLKGSRFSVSMTWRIWSTSWTCHWPAAGRMAALARLIGAEAFVAAEDREAVEPFIGLAPFPAAPFDGAYMVLRVARAGATGFAGTWESGVEGRKTQGRFCADRTGA